MTTYSCIVSNATGYTYTEYTTMGEAMNKALETSAQYIKEGYTFIPPCSGYPTTLLSLVGQQDAFPYHTVCIYVEKQE